MHTKRVPLRKCTGCGEMKPKKSWYGWSKAPRGNCPRSDGQETRPRRLCLPLARLSAGSTESETVGKSLFLPDSRPVYERMEEELRSDGG